MTLDDTHAAIGQNSATPKHSSHESRSADASIATLSRNRPPWKRTWILYRRGQTTKQRHSPSQSPSLVGLSTLHAIHTYLPPPPPPPPPRRTRSSSSHGSDLLGSLSDVLSLAEGVDREEVRFGGSSADGALSLLSPVARAHLCLGPVASRGSGGRGQMALLSGTVLLWSPRLHHQGRVSTMIAGCD